MESFQLSGVFALLAFLCFLWWKPSRKTIGNEAPEPVGAWPVIGHLHLLMGPDLPYQAFGRLADKYGPAYAIRLGVHKALVVSDWKIARECLTTNDKTFATRPKLVAVKLMGYNFALSGLGPYGPYWREMRKFAMVELLSNHRIDSLKHVWESEITTSVNELFQMCADNTGKQSALVEMGQWFNDLTSNVSVRVVAGKRYYGASAKFDEDAIRFKDAIRVFVRLLGTFMVADLIPFLRWLDFGRERAMKKAAEKLDSMLARWLHEHKQDKLSGATKVERDFMDVLLTVLDDKDLFGFTADVVNKATCLNMIMAGADTIAVTLVWALSLLLNNQQFLKKAQDEIEAIVGKERQVDVSDIDKLVFLQAIVKETLRLYPPGPLITREAMKDSTVAGYHVPVGTRLIINVRKVQRDPLIWSNPCEFQPERFLTTHVNCDVRGQQFELIPFGSGRRSCPAVSFSLQVVHLTLARLLQGFNFETPSNAPVDMTEGAGLSNIKANPLQVLITPRLPPNLY